MIPKKIHYCWFGNGKMPRLAGKCIKSWKRVLPDYEYILWNESNFDINSIIYTREAYESGKYAFVTDYVRLFALYHFGGIYLDTDVEVLKRLDDLLVLPGFSGFESDTHIPTGIIASEPYNPWVKEQLSWYNGKHFLKENGKSSNISNVQIISANMAAQGIELNNTYQVFRNCMHFFPKDFFCPKSRSGIITLTANTYCIHHFAASWLPIHLQVKRYFFHKLLGPTITDFLVKKKRKLNTFLNRE